MTHVTGRYGQVVQETLRAAGHRVTLIFNRLAYLRRRTVFRVAIGLIIGAKTFLHEFGQ